MVKFRPDHALRKWRKSQKLTLAGAADLVSGSRQLWYDWETGRRRPGPKYMGRIRAVTRDEVTADHFYPVAELDELQNAA